jgi:hypothetical protein
VNALQEARPLEVRWHEESQWLADVSVSTLLYMMDYGLARERDLRRHHLNLGYLAEDEHDLFEAMRLSARLNRVETNTARTARVNERLRAELVVRDLGPQDAVGRPRSWAYSPFTTDANHDRSGLDEDRPDQNDSAENPPRPLG